MNDAETNKEDPCWNCEILGYECLRCEHFITGYEPLGEKRHEEKEV